MCWHTVSIITPLVLPGYSWVHTFKIKAGWDENSHDRTIKTFLESVYELKIETHNMIYWNVKKCIVVCVFSPEGGRGTFFRWLAGSCASSSSQLQHVSPPQCSTLVYTNNRTLWYVFPLSFPHFCKGLSAKSDSKFKLYSCGCCLVILIIHIFDVFVIHQWYQGYTAWVQCGNVG